MPADLAANEFATTLQRILGSAYRIERELGGGGMSRVFLAHETALSRQVVVKILPPELVTRASAERFQREIAVTVQLEHPHIIPIITAGAHKDLLYYITPYIAGETIRQRLDRDTRVPFRDCVPILREIVDALAFAHDRKVVHRDIKPSNILLAHGHVRIADFGIALAIDKASAETTRLTRTGSGVGTIGYMAPEQLSGRDVDARADVYALGVLAYEMLTGELPSPQVATTWRDWQRSAPHLRLAPAVPRQAWESIGRALSPRPSDRFADATEFATAMAAWPESNGFTSARSRWFGRHRVWGYAAVAIAALGFAGFAAARLRQNAGREAPRLTSGLGRVVVAPLENRTGIDSLKLVGLMAGDWITEGLQKTGKVEVVPTASAVFVSKYVAGDTTNPNLPSPMKALAEEVGAETVVAGALYRQGDRILFRVDIAAQRGTKLVGTVTEVFSPINDPIGGVLELKNRLMGWLAVQYDERLQDPDAERDRPPTYDAYREFSDGMTRYVASENGPAVPHFLRAYQLDSSFTAALLYASIALSNVSDFARADSILRLVDARRNTLSEYDRAWLDYRSAFLAGNHEAALTAIRNAARLGPASKSVYNHAVAAFEAARLREALTAVESIEPDRGAMRGHAPYWTIYGSILHARRDYSRERTIGNAARNAYPNRLVGFVPVVRSAAATGDGEAVAQALSAAATIPPDPYYWDYGLLLAEAAEEFRAHGYAAEATKHLEQLQSWLERNPQAARAQWRRVETLYALRRFDAAGDALAAIRNTNASGVDAMGMRGLLLCKTGRIAEARLIIDSLAARRQPYDRGAASVYRARIAAAAGDRERALAALSQSFREGKAFGLFLHRDPDLAALRGVPEFDALIRGMD